MHMFIVKNNYKNKLEKLRLNWRLRNLGKILIWGSMLANINVNININMRSKTIVVTIMRMEVLMIKGFVIRKIK